MNQRTAAVEDQDHPLLGVSQRLRPQNIPAEQALLGAILANNKAYDRVASFLKPHHFADPLHGGIFEECGRLIADGKVADPISLRPWFQTCATDFGAPVDPAYLASLLGAMVGIINADTYGKAIQEAWAKRALIEVGVNLVNRGFNETLESPNIVAETIPELEDTLAKGGFIADVSLKVAINRVMESAWNAQNHGEMPMIYATDIPDLDPIIGGGLRKADLFILGGRPGHGKSALAMQVGLSLAERYGLPTEILTMEMTAEQQAARALSQVSRVPLTAIEFGKLSASEADRLMTAQKKLVDLPVNFDARGRLTMSQVSTAVRGFRRRFGKVGLIVVDHMHLMLPNPATLKAGLGLAYAIGEIANELKNLAKQEDCPVIALAQLNRSKESADDKVPTMADLKNSGDIEAAADTVLFTHREELHLHKAKPSRKPGESDSEYLNRETEYHRHLADVSGQVTLVSGKCRKGKTGSVQLRFEGETTSFLPLD